MSSEEADIGVEKQFHNHDDLDHAGKFAATLSAFSWRPERGFVADPSEPTGTVTFLEIEGKTYALTAEHVVDELEKFAKKSPGVALQGFFVPVGNGMPISGPFIVPPQDPAAKDAPDIALCPVARELLAAIGKEPFVVTAGNGLPGKISHGYAVGFPTGRKEDKAEPGGSRLAMQCVHALAEYSSDNVDLIRFVSEMNKPLLPGTRLSGMSGGPVFWSDGETYGIAGFVIEAVDSEPEESIYGDKVVQFVAQRADYETLCKWAAYVDRNWQAERDKLNGKL